MPLLTDLDKTFTVDNRSHRDRSTITLHRRARVRFDRGPFSAAEHVLHILGGFEPASSGTRLNSRYPPGPDRGMMFQELSLFPWLTAIENVAWPLEMKGLPKRERLPKAAEYLDLVHLARFADLYPGQLSGGMKQRVALARLFALDPEIMLMDEPFGALDSQTRELLQEELQSIWRRARKTALFVTHDIDEAIYLGTRVIVFTARPGRIKADIRIPEIDRSGDFRKSREYLALRVQVWDLLRERSSRRGRWRSVRSTRPIRTGLCRSQALVAEIFGRAGMLPRYLSRRARSSRRCRDLRITGESFRRAAPAFIGYRPVCARDRGQRHRRGSARGSPASHISSDPLVSFLYSIPKIAFLPVFPAVLGLGHASRSRSSSPASFPCSIASSRRSQ